MSDPVFIAGTGAALGARVEAADAVKDGRYPEEFAARTSVDKVAIASPDQSPLELAALAGQYALDRSGHKPAHVESLVHARTNSLGLLDAWNPAAHIAHQLSLPNADIATEWVAACTGGLTAVQFGIPYLRADPDRQAVMITAADVWPQEYIDRWRADGDMPMGDGAGALLLSRRHGFARVLGVVTRSDYTLEGLARGGESLAPRPPGARNFNLHSRYSHFMRATRIRKEEIWRRRETLMADVLELALQRAGLDSAQQFDHVILPSIGEHVFDREWAPWLGVDLDRTTWEYGATTGHIGPADPLAGLNWLVEKGRLRPGDRVLAIMDGLGIVCSAAVLEITETPDPSV